ncbi:hypothetical protein [Nostoc sp.]
MSDVQRQAAYLRDAPQTRLRTFQRDKAGTSNFTNPSLVSSHILHQEKLM